MLGRGGAGERWNRCWVEVEQVLGRGGTGAGERWNILFLVDLYWALDLVVPCRGQESRGLPGQFRIQDVWPDTCALSHSVDRCSFRSWSTLGSMLCLSWLLNFS